MKYLGIFPEDKFYLDGKNLKIFMAYIEDTELIIRYDGETPFLIKEIGIFLEKSETYGSKMYSVWEYEHFSKYDSECIAVAKQFATEVTNYLKDTLRYFKETERIIDKRPTP